MSASRPVFRTRLCDVLGIDYPILQSGMGGVAGPALAAEVSNAGGLGMLAAALPPADQLRQGIDEIRAKTDRPFGVNLLLSHDLRPPAPATAIPEAAVQAAAGQGNPEYFPLWAGQSVGLINDLPSAAEVVERTIREARALLLERLPQAVQLSA